jgi:hypothetical protein
VVASNTPLTTDFESRQLTVAEHRVHRSLGEFQSQRDIANNEDLNHNRS